ncbi:MAG TPA: hypothetical protein DIS79_02865 [Bacteroidetes bacterium]|nr:hypothetical protein [Bacteroidota bacterium]HRK04416.1 hypothetical protein [Chlorobiota bacterium]
MRTAPHHVTSGTLPLLLLTIITLSSCVSITRTERDVHTITRRDTTRTDRVNNTPGDRDNGVIFPSSRTLVTERHIVQYDSVAEREYPNFIRLGVFEGVSLIGSAIDGESTLNGLFGLFPTVDKLLRPSLPKEERSALFSGSILRFGIGEWRLRIFDDAPGWSWGVTAFETLTPDDNSANTLRGAGVLTLTKRWYLRSKIPYGAIRASSSFALFPSQYVNTSVSADLGSIGGLNLRFYAGYAFGMSGQSVTDNGLTFPSAFVNFPYIGLGFSSFDFLNREEELDVEWKYHEHSAWSLQPADFVLLGADVENGLWGRRENANGRSSLITGIAFRLGSADLALPFLDYRLSVGTSLLNTVVLGTQDFGIGVLPIRVSYMWHPFVKDFAVQPFLEYNFAPSSFVHLGARGSLPISEQVTLQVVAAYVSGSNGSLFGVDFEGQLGGIERVEGVYIGIGASLFDHFFNRDELRYGKGYPHE